MASSTDLPDAYATLSVAITAILEDSHEPAASVAHGKKEMLKRAKLLRRAGDDICSLALAMEVVVRRAHGN